MVPIRTILHPCFEFIITRCVQYTPKKLFSNNEAKKSIQRHSIISTDSDYGYILDEIERGKENEFESNVSVNSDEESQ